MKKQIKLSIIIPYYNAEPYTSELLDVLAPQITDEVEVIVIDDGSKVPFETKHGFVAVVRQQNKGCSSARNCGIDKTIGEYISFIDADDLVSNNFVSRILEKTKDGPDIIELSWKSLNGNMWNIDARLSNENTRLSNPSVCTRVFKRSFIGDIRFNENKDSTEDEDFSRRLGYAVPLGDTKPLRDNKTVVITDYMYFYRDDVVGSKTKRYASGYMNTKRVVYYYDHVHKDWAWLMDEIKKDDETNEVFLFTNQCDMPELKRYCRIEKPHKAWAHIKKGDPCDLITQKAIPQKTQVVLYRKNLNAIGGITTFMLNFIEQMRDLYDITILCQNCMSNERLMQLMPKVRVVVGLDKPLACDTLVILSFLDHIPKNVKAGKIVRMCHACRTDKSWAIPNDYDELLYVSEAAMHSFDVDDGKVVHNFKNPYKKDTLLLVSATRLPAPDKGDIEARTRCLCEMMTKADIPFVWLNFSDGRLPNPPKGFYNMGVSFDIEGIIQKATYVVTLSDSECWSYTVLEALTNGVPLICTPFESAFEQGVKDGVNAHVIPFDMDFDVNILRKVPKFSYKYDNDKVKKQWLDVLGEPKPHEKYKPDSPVLVKVLSTYFDVLLGKGLEKGTELIMTKQRAQQIINTNQNLIEILREVET